MIASWMLAATCLGLIVVFAATALERALRLLGRQGRLAWVLALAVTVGWPLIAPALLRPADSAAAVSVISTAPVTRSVVATAPASRTAAFVGAARAMLANLDTPLARLDSPLAALWGAATLLLLLRAAVAMRALRRLTNSAERRTIDGQSVLVSPQLGPAAFGIVDPHIVLPSWSLDLDVAMRAMVLRHEQQHVAARDPATLTLAWIGAALMPWNAALWIISRRLRVATELDCDHRVVRQGTDARRYAQLLLLMVQRQMPAAFAAPMAGSPTTLHERIDAMHLTTPSRPRLRAGLLLVLTLLGAFTAASPALAGELAAVRTKFAPDAQQSAPVIKPTIKTAPSPRSTVLELPLIVVSPDRSVEVPVMQAPPQQPVKRAPADSAVKRAPTVARKVVTDTVRRWVGVDSVPRKVVHDSAGRWVAVDSAPARQGYFDFKVDGPVAFAPGGSPTPRYPDILRSAGVSGDVILQVVVDTSGMPLENSLKVVRKSHDLFEASFRSVFSQIRFIPASVDARKVRQLVQLVYRFDLDGATPTPMPVVSPGITTFVINVTAKPR